MVFLSILWGYFNVIVTLFMVAEFAKYNSRKRKHYTVRSLTYFASTFGLILISWLSYINWGSKWWS